MVDKTQRAHAANNVLNNEVIMEALTDAEATITKELLAAPTIEEREQKYQEYCGIKRTRNRLAIWASKVRNEGNQEQ